MLLLSLPGMPVLVWMLASDPSFKLSGALAWLFGLYLTAAIALIASLLLFTAHLISKYRHAR